MGPDSGCRRTGRSWPSTTARSLLFSPSFVRSMQRGTPPFEETASGGAHLKVGGIYLELLGYLIRLQPFEYII